jgi:hypothetical protein
MGKIADFVLQSLLRTSPSSGDLIVEFGTASFTTTGETVEVSTDLSEIDAAFFTVQSVGTIDAQDAPLCTDGVVTTNAVTVKRQATGS